MSAVCKIICPFLPAPPEKDALPPKKSEKLFVLRAIFLRQRGPPRKSAISRVKQPRSLQHTGFPGDADCSAKPQKMNLDFFRQRKNSGCDARRTPLSLMHGVDPGPSSGAVRSKTLPPFGLFSAWFFPWGFLEGERHSFPFFSRDISFRECGKKAARAVEFSSPHAASGRSGDLVVRAAGISLFCVSRPRLCSEIRRREMVRRSIFPFVPHRKPVSYSLTVLSLGPLRPLSLS